MWSNDVSTRFCSLVYAYLDGDGVTCGSQLEIGFQRHTKISYSATHNASDETATVSASSVRASTTFSFTVQGERNKERKEENLARTLWQTTRTWRERFDIRNFVRSDEFRLRRNAVA